MTNHNHTIKFSWDFDDLDALESGEVAFTAMDILGCPDSSICPIFQHEDWDELWDNGSVDELLEYALYQHKHSKSCERPDGSFHCVSTLADTDAIIQNSEVGYLFDSPNGR